MWQGYPNTNRLDTNQKFFIFGVIIFLMTQFLIKQWLFNVFKKTWPIPSHKAIFPLLADGTVTKSHTKESFIKLGSLIEISPSNAFTFTFCGFIFSERSIWNEFDAHKDIMW